MQKKKAKKYAGLRDEQFSLVEHYAQRHGINSKFLLVFTWIYNNPEGITQEFICKRTYSSKQVIKFYRQKSYEEGVALSRSDSK